MRDDRLYLVHIRECIDRIRAYTVEGKESFLQDGMKQDAVYRNLQIMGESTQRISDGLKSEHPDVDWRGIAGFRNVLVHDYLGVDPIRVWNIIEDDLSTFASQTEAIEQGLATEAEHSGE